MPVEVKTGKYVNAFAVHIKDGEVVLDAGFHAPGGEEVEIVSRVIMNHKAAENFISTVQNALLDWRNKSGGAKKGK